jgi:hypothetical protein
MAFGKLKPLRISSWNINGLRRQITRLGTLSALLQSLEAGGAATGQSMHQSPSMAAGCTTAAGCIQCEHACMRRACACTAAPGQWWHRHPGYAVLCQLTAGMPAAADIICFQETKVRRGDLERELALAEGW